MADRYGFTGDVSFIGQDRYLAYYNGPAGQPAPAPLGGLGSVRPVLSGNFTGAPGKRVMREQSTRDRDGAMFASLGVRFAGPRYDSREVRMRALAGRGLGDLTREQCNTLMTTAGALATLGAAAARAGLPLPPTRRAGESAAAFESRLAAYRRQHGSALDGALAADTAGRALQTTASLCNLISESTPTMTPPASSSGPSAWELALLQRQMESSSGGSGSGIQTSHLLLGGGALVVAGVVAYLLLK